MDGPFQSEGVVVKMVRFLGFLIALFSLAECVPSWGQADTKVAADLVEGAAAMERGDYATAMRIFRPLADKGYGDAQYNIGFMYRYGLGAQTDATAAALWFRKAADLGVADAEANLGVMYKVGEGVPRDNTKALKWLQAASGQGIALAQWGLGAMYYEGQGVVKNYAEAMKFYRKAADQGHPLSQFSVGVMYDFGRGVAKSPVEAVKWYRLAANQEQPAAQFALAIKLLSGEGTLQNLNEGEKYLQKAADQGISKAQQALDDVRKIRGEQSAQTKPGLAGPQPQATAQVSPPIADAATPQNALKGRDLALISKTYNENEMRFKRDFAGRQFLDVMVFRSASEKMLSKGEYNISFGSGVIVGDLYCSVSAPSDIAEIANWNKGDRIHVEGVIADVTMGAVMLKPCTMSK